MNRQQLLSSARTKKHRPGPLLASIIASLVPREPSDGQHIGKIAGALRAGQFDRAITLSESRVPTEYGSKEDFFFWTQVAQLVRKVPFTDPCLRPEQSAWSKFQAAEHSCRRINQRLRAERTVGRERYSLHRDIARRWILKVIGQKPNIDRILRQCDFGPGASVGVHGTDTNAAAKLLSGSWTVTPSCVPYAFCSLSDDYHVREMFSPSQDGTFCYDDEAISLAIRQKFVLVDYNKITMVPKTAKVHRTIAIEPLFNGYVQKGVDSEMKRLLLRVGIDLTDQTLNQRLAMLGSLGGFNPFVTIDLSAASDSIAIQTVKDLLPPEWFNFLNRIRSPNYESKWGNGRYEKFTSMGNGFCFPLESLIFASLCVAANEFTSETEFSVFGDDIIVRQSAALFLLELLKFYGFSANTDKTFVFGDFRESCGADYILGVNVRPYVLDFLPETDRDLMKIYNGLQVNEGFRALVKPAMETIYRKINYLPHKPECYTESTDDALTVPLDIYMSHWSAKWHRDEQRWQIIRMIDTPVSREGGVSSSIQMYGLLRGILPKDFEPNFTLRRRTRTSLKVW